MNKMVTRFTFLLLATFAWHVAIVYGQTPYAYGVFLPIWAAGDCKSVMSELTFSHWRPLLGKVITKTNQTLTATIAQSVQGERHRG
jgi:hypothetical protein